jgi:hypothetical protein
MRRDIDEALNGWPYEAEAGEILAREVKTRDGRMVLQVRIELGLLQMEQDGRPDGLRPHGFTTYLEYLIHRVTSSSRSRSWTMSQTQCAEADREFIQFFHRRVGWLAVQRFDKALRDADHTLALMDFVADYGPTAEYISSHERLRGLVLFHRTQAAAALALEHRKPDEAIDAVQEGSEALSEHERDWITENPEDELPNSTLIEQLDLVAGEIRKNFAVEKTLREQLDEAVADENYEKAAQLRDQIKAKTRQ